MPDKFQPLAKIFGETWSDLNPGTHVRAGSNFQENLDKGLDKSPFVPFERTLPARMLLATRRHLHIPSMSSFSPQPLAAGAATTVQERRLFHKDGRRAS